MNVVQIQNPEVDVLKLETLKCHVDACLVKIVDAKAPLSKAPLSKFEDEERAESLNVVSLQSQMVTLKFQISAANNKIKLAVSELLLASGLFLAYRKPTTMHSFN